MNSIEPISGAPSATKPETHQAGRGTARAKATSRIARVKALNSIWLLGLLILIIVIFTVQSPGHFLTPFNIRTIAVNASVLTVLAVGQAFVIMGAGIDLSIGGVLVFSTVAIAKVLQHTGGAASSWYAMLGACLVGILAGAAWGFVNGLVIQRAKVPALIVTLGSAGASLGLAEVITNGNDLSNVPAALTNGLGNGNVVGQVPWLVIVALVIALLAGAVLIWFRFGRYTLAVGSSPAAAARAGINVNRQLITLYTMSGLCAGIAGVLSIARFSSTTIGGHSSDSLAAIAAVVLGGTSLFGGSGSIFGAVLGALVPTVLADGFVIAGLPPFWQSVAVGVILVIAVVADRTRRELQERS